MRYSIWIPIPLTVFLLSIVVPASAENLIVDSGGGASISVRRELSATEQYQNKGTVTITAAGILAIADGVTNVEPLGEGVSGLDLGVVNSSGTIDADTFLRFQAGSTLGGTLISTSNIAFDGASTITGSVQAATMIVNAGSDTSGVFKIDLTGTGAGLDVDELILNSAVKVTMKSGTALKLEELNLGAASSLAVTENIVVQGNYTGIAGSTIGSGVDANGVYQGTISLLGGGSRGDGVNNYIAQSAINAATLELKNYTSIESVLTLSGDLHVLEGGVNEGEESLVYVNSAVLTKGKTTLEADSVLRFNIEETETTKLHTYGYYNYMGVFLGGLEMKDGSRIDVKDDDQTIRLALGAASTIADGAEIKAGNLYLTGVSTTDSSELTARTVENQGSISVDGTLHLASVKLSTAGTGTLEVNSLKMTGTSVLEIGTGGTLTFTGKDRLLDIGATSQVSAANQTLKLNGVEVINKNASSTNAIIAQTLFFGDGSSLSGPGFFDAETTFETGSTLKIDNTGFMVFNEQNVIFKEGSTIELTIGTNGVGALVTEGAIKMEEGVILEITDGSSYTGRTRQYQILQGSSNSVFTGLVMAESLFFELNQTLTTDDGQLWVEVVKVNELVDYADSSNQYNLSSMVDNLLNEGRVSDDQKTVFNAVMRIADDESFRQALNELSGSSRENAIIYALSSPWTRPFNSIGFNRLSLALPNESYAGEGDPTTLGQKKSWLPKVSKPKWNLPRWSFSQDLWADMYYDYTKLNDDGNSQGGHGNRGGFHAGTALPSPSKESLLGITAGYSSAEYKQAHDKVDLNDLQLGIYGGVNLFSRNLQLRGYVGYGMQDYKYKRNVQIGGNSPMAVSGDTDGDSISAALYLVRPMDMSPRYMFKPMVGFDMERITQDGFSETGIAAVALNYEDVTLNRVMWRLGATGDLELDRVDLNWRFLYGLKVAGDGSIASTHRFMSPGNDPFEIRSVNIGDYAFDLGFGGNWELNRRRTVLLFMDYNANFTKNSSIHTSSLGLLWKR